jgi:hypothetical protein
VFQSTALHKTTLRGMDPVKKQQIEWVRAVMSYLGVPSANRLAELAGVNPANIQRPLSDNYKGKFGATTIARIAEAANLRPMEFPSRPAGMNEAEAQRYVYESAGDINEGNVERAVRELCRGRNGRDPWVMRSHALELSGIVPGDVLIVDMNLQPKPKDVVCAQIYSGHTAETVFRIFEPPYLVTHSLRFGTQKPVPVDGEEVVIRGVVDVILRRRH